MRQLTFYYNNDSGISGSSKNKNMHPVVDSAAIAAPNTAKVLTTNFNFIPPFFYIPNNCYILVLEFYN